MSSYIYCESGLIEKLISLNKKLRQNQNLNYLRLNKKLFLQFKNFFFLLF
jgi:hypothetical protein